MDIHTYTHTYIFQFLILIWVYTQLLHSSFFLYLYRPIHSFTCCDYTHSVVCMLILVQTSACMNETENGNHSELANAFWFWTRCVKGQWHAETQQELWRRCCCTERGASWLSRFLYWYYVHAAFLFLPLLCFFFFFFTLLKLVPSFASFPV